MVTCAQDGVPDLLRLHTDFQFIPNLVKWLRHLCENVAVLSALNHLILLGEMNRLRLYFVAYFLVIEALRAFKAHKYKIYK